MLRALSASVYNCGMTEVFANSIEQEIAQLSEEIAAKRRELEAARGISHESESDKEILRASLAEKIQMVVPPLPPPPPPGVGAKPAATGSSYLDDLDPETAEKVNSLIQEVFSKGLESAIQRVKKEDVYVIDAFHDALVDKMYEELKRRKAVS